MPAPTLTTARRSAAPRLPSPEGLSKRRKAVCRGSSSWHTSWRERIQTATHSTQSTAPLQSRSRERARASKCCSGTAVAGVSRTSVRPRTNSAKSRRPSSLASRAKNKSYQGTGSLHCMSSSSEVIWAQTTSASCCRASRCAKRQRSLSSASPMSAFMMMPGSFGLRDSVGFGPRGEARTGMACCETGTSTPAWPSSTHGCRKAWSLGNRTSSFTTRSRRMRSCASPETSSQASRPRSYSPAWMRRTVTSCESSADMRKGLAPTKSTYRTTPKDHESAKIVAPRLL
mmetsp:Transcript_55725/g.172742  ORF Transcript_55725/g.172742 Transcript_55725/m.172742 type:complete len:286 (-) Transcript_55725:395-1252(-)